MIFFLTCNAVESTTCLQSPFSFHLFIGHLTSLGAIDCISYSFALAELHELSYIERHHDCVTSVIVHTLISDSRALPVVSRHVFLTIRELRMTMEFGISEIWMFFFEFDHLTSYRWCRSWTRREDHFHVTGWESPLSMLLRNEGNRWLSTESAKKEMSTSCYCEIHHTASIILFQLRFSYWRNVILIISTWFSSFSDIR